MSIQLYCCYIFILYLPCVVTVAFINLAWKPAVVIKVVPTLLTHVRVPSIDCLSSVIFSNHSCLSVCLSGTAWPIFAKFCVQIPGGRGLVLQRRRAMLYTSSFMDDITFGRNGRKAERWRLHRAAMAMNDVTIPGWSLMSMNACWMLLLSCYVFGPVWAPGL